MHTQGAHIHQTNHSSPTLNSTVMVDKWTEGEGWHRGEVGDVQHDVSFVAVSIPALLENIQEYVESINNKKGFISAGFADSSEDQDGLSPTYVDGSWHETLFVYWEKGVDFGITGRPFASLIEGAEEE